MSFVKKEKSTNRNYDKEAELQIKILEQKSREDYLVHFSQSENLTTTTNFGNEMQSRRRPETDTKTSIPTNAKVILEKWMYEHRLYCYPTKAEKQALSYETGLSVQKISNWFINSRRRTLPKVLQTEGKSADDFTISRKKKNPDVAATTATNCFAALNDATSLADYANQEEEKVIDQSSIFYGKDFNIEITPSSVPQEIVRPSIEPCSENLKASYQAMAEKIQQEEEWEEQQGSISNSSQAVVEAQQASEPQSLTSASSTFLSRGILYDEATKSKCLYIVINSPG